MEGEVFYFIWLLLFISSTTYSESNIAGTLDDNGLSLMYPYEIEDYQPLSTGNSRINVQLPFEIPFYRSSFNSAWIHLNGHISFDGKEAFHKYPLNFPKNHWPQEIDPTFVAPFYAKSDIGDIEESPDNRKAGVYFRVIGDISTQDVKDFKQKITSDIRDGMIGTTDFEPKHLLIVTWKNLTFQDSNNKSLTNTFQLLLATDEIRTYVIFNYEKIVWTSSTEAGGNSSTGLGGTTAYVGFNAGNGTAAYQYKPYSQRPLIVKLLTSGGVNGFPGRHIFRVDEEILQGTCNFLREYNAKLLITPERGNALGNTVINITGPCFTESDPIKLTIIGGQEQQCQYINRNTATCILPPTMSHGIVDISAVSGFGNLFFIGKFYYENPLLANEIITVDEEDELFQREISSHSITIRWNNSVLGFDDDQQVNINLYGYEENDNGYSIILIKHLAVTPNSGEYPLDSSLWKEFTSDAALEYLFGFFQVNATEQNKYNGIPTQWSRPFPLGWFLNNQWNNKFGTNWPSTFCRQWEENDRLFDDFVDTLPSCPCTLRQALADKGKFVPDFECDQWGNTKCYGFKQIKHCVILGQPTVNGNGQQCCYNAAGNLILNSNGKEGGIPNRVHRFWNTTLKVAGLSHWFHDRAPFYFCCNWQNQNSDGCQQYRLRRPSQDCSGYVPSKTAIVLGDPHVITFDNLAYSFNAKGEYNLMRANNSVVMMRVQGRFEQVLRQNGSDIQALNATLLTTVVCIEKFSSRVQLQIRPSAAQRRYKMSLWVDYNRINLDSIFERILPFKGLTIYQPSYIINQSQVIIAFSSGAGVEVLQSEGQIGVRVFLPPSFKFRTEGLMGNWTDDPEDDLAFAQSSKLPPLPSNSSMATIYNKFKREWCVGNTYCRDSAYFFNDFDRSSYTYFDESFTPLLSEPEPVDPLTENDVAAVCGLRTSQNYQCRFDYLVTQNKYFAKSTKYQLDTFNQMNADLMSRN